MGKHESDSAFANLFKAASGATVGRMTVISALLCNAAAWDCEICFTDISSRDSSGTIIRKLAYDIVRGLLDNSNVINAHDYLQFEEFTLSYARPITPLSTQFDAMLIDENATLVQVSKEIDRWINDEEIQVEHE